MYLFMNTGLSNRRSVRAKFMSPLKNSHKNTNFPLLTAEFDIQMKKCFAFDETDTALTLVDDK